MYVIGLISGTSMDAIDAALVAIERDGDLLRLAVRAFAMISYEPALRERVGRLIPPEPGTTAEVCAVNVLIGEAFASAAQAVADQAGLPIGQVDLIASHGQTVYHQVAEGQVRSTLQLGAPAVIAERTGCTVVADFRPRDLAAGGQGAPLVPYLDLLLLHDRQRCRAVQNIGGIGNVTYLPARPPTTDHRLPTTGSNDKVTRRQGDKVMEDRETITPSPPDPFTVSESSVIGRQSSVVAFDTGPGNVLIDEAMRLLTAGAQGYDRDGRMAAAGQIDEGLLDEWLGHPFFELPPPRSTGRELFGVAEAHAYVEQGRARGLAPEDIIATLTALTAHSIAESYRRYCGRIDEVLVSGGGARNPTLLGMIAAALPEAAVRPLDELALDAEAKEAIAFAVAGYATLHGWPNNVPAATGASHPVVLGSITPGANYRALLAQVHGAPLSPPDELRVKSLSAAPLK